MAPQFKIATKSTPSISASPFDLLSTIHVKILKVQYMITFWAKSCQLNWCHFSTDVTFNSKSQFISCQKPRQVRITEKMLDIYSEKNHKGFEAFKDLSSQADFITWIGFVPYICVVKFSDAARKETPISLPAAIPNDGRYLQSNYLPPIPAMLTIQQGVSAEQDGKYFLSHCHN